MKKFTGFLALVALFPVFASASSFDSVTLNRVEEVVLNRALLGVNPMNMIDWKVGDTNRLSVQIGPMPGGSMVQTVASEEGDAIWLHQDLDMQFQKQNIQMLMSRVDGKVLKLIVNGKEQSIPEQKIEVIEQRTDKVTVPAGTFDVMYVKVKADGKIIEVWANPFEIAMDGVAKQVADLGLGGMSLTMELQSTTRGN